jgi:hypothetical protein
MTLSNLDSSYDTFAVMIRALDKTRGTASGIVELGCPQDKGLWLAALFRPCLTTGNTGDSRRNLSQSRCLPAAKLVARGLRHEFHFT